MNIFLKDGKVKELLRLWVGWPDDNPDIVPFDGYWNLSLQCTFSAFRGRWSRIYKGRFPRMPRFLLFNCSGLPLR